MSYGVVNEILDNEYNFTHKFSTRRGSSGSPMLKTDDNKVIGIHNRGTNQSNEGTFLNYPIKEFIQQNCYYTIKYKIFYYMDHNDSIRIFGDEFVKNNEENFYLLINGQESKLYNHHIKTQFGNE